MPSPLKTILIVFLISCLVAGGGTLYLAMVNEPMEFLSTTGTFNYRYALIWFIFSGLLLGVQLFAALLVGIGFFAVLGFRWPKLPRRSRQSPDGNDVSPPASSS